MGYCELAAPVTDRSNYPSVVDVDVVVVDCNATVGDRSRANELRRAPLLDGNGAAGNAGIRNESFMRTPSLSSPDACALSYACISRCVCVYVCERACVCEWRNGESVANFQLERRLRFIRGRAHTLRHPRPHTHKLQPEDGSQDVLHHSPSDRFLPTPPFRSSSHKLRQLRCGIESIMRSGA